MDDNRTFTAIDFETAHGANSSICQVGLVRVEQGIVVQTMNILVQPPENKYHWGNSRVHGINKRMTAHAPTFDQIWESMKPYITNQLIVAHNAKFDAGCLRSTLAFYDLVIPPFATICTFELYRSNLKALCQKYHIPLNHHDALSDANACATLYLNYLASPSIIEAV